MVGEPKDSIRSLPEIRLNDRYAHLYYSHFKGSGDKEESIPIIKKKTLFIEDYMKKALVQTNNDILPPNCRYVEKTSGGWIFLIEEPPALRTINIRLNLTHEKEILDTAGKLSSYGYEEYNFSKQVHTFSLAFPYVIFLIYVTTTYDSSYGQVFVRPSRISGLSDYICKMPLPNISDQQTVCFGDAAFHRHRSLHEAIEHIIMVFWSAEFNRDYLYNRTEYSKTPILSTFAEWEYMSRENPMFIYNAEWIQLPGNISNQLHFLKKELCIVEETKTSFGQLSKMFYYVLDSGKKMKKLGSRRAHPLYYDICQGTYLNSHIHINVGDTIKMHNGDIAYIDSFVGFMSGGDIKYILFDHNGRKFHMKFTAASIDFLVKQIEDQHYTNRAKLKDGTIIKTGDIISLKSGKETYRKVEYIRQSRGEEDIKELKLGNEYYLVHNIEATIIDTKNPVIHGVPLKKDAQYIISSSPNSASIITAAIYAKFHSLDVSNNQIIAKFKSNQGDMHHMSLGDTSYQLVPIIDKEQCKPMPAVFRIGRKLYKIRRHGESSTFPKSNIVLWNFNGRVLHDYHCRVSMIQYEDIQNFIKKDEFNVAGTDFNTSFKMGDKVIYANWKNPLDVLSIKTLLGFKHDEATGDIYFILGDKNEKMSKVKYVSHDFNAIYTGRIRKVTNKFKKLSVGTKIIANKSSIPAFPKKDVNIIVAIIIDSPYEPLILCSNGCTLWYSTVIKDFEHITMKSKKWKTLNHAPLDLSKIKFQAGDIVNGISGYSNNEGYLLFNPPNSKTPRALPIFQYAQHEDSASYTIDKYFMREMIFDCIPNPRVSARAKYAQGFYDFHGSLIKQNRSIYSFIDERGDIKNVSSTRK